MGSVHLFTSLGYRVDPDMRAISSAVERCLHTAEATGSRPVSPTIETPVQQGFLHF